MTIIAIYGSLDKLLPYVAVAPHVGAWIEIRQSQRSGTQHIVAPHVGAWIEICRPCL